MCHPVDAELCDRSTMFAQAQAEMYWLVTGSMLCVHACLSREAAMSVLITCATSSNSPVNVLVVGDLSGHDHYYSNKSRHELTNELSKVM